MAPSEISNPGGGASPVNRIRGREGAEGISSIRRARARATTGAAHVGASFDAARSGETPSVVGNPASTAEGALDSVSSEDAEGAKAPVPTAETEATERRPTALRTRPSGFEGREITGLVAAGLRRTQPRPNGSWARRTIDDGTGRARISSCVRYGGRQGWPGRPARVGDGSERSRRRQTGPGSGTGRTPRREEAFFMGHQGTAKTAPSIWLREPARCNPRFTSASDIFPAGPASRT